MSRVLRGRIGALADQPRPNERATPATSIHAQHTPNASSRASGRRNRRRTASTSTATGSQIGIVTVISTANASSAGTLHGRAAAAALARER